MKDATKRRKRRRKIKPDLVFTSTVPWRGRAPDEPMLIGYVRVSTDVQDTQRQVDELVKAGVAACDIWGDIASGKDMDRTGWQNMMRELEPGDVLVVHALDRISRDTLDTLTTFRALAERGVKVRVLTLGLDTNTPVGRFTLTMMAGFAQLEREMILMRTMSGLQRAKERGVFLGAVKRFPDAAIAEAVKTHGTYEAAAQALGCKRITIARGMARIKAAEDAAKAKEQKDDSATD